MKYLSYINRVLSEELPKHENLVLFGQNITLGSCLGGLCRNLKLNPTTEVINSTNSENTLVGMGFGLMANGISSIFFVKQLDFLLLGMDHFVNTWNFFRQTSPKASFTIIPTIVDNGWQGMQSSLNNLAEFCSIARVPGLTVTNRHDCDRILRENLVSPGFRMIGVSARLGATDLIEFEGPIQSTEDCGIFQYANGEDATIVCFNYTLPEGMKLWREIESLGKSASLFNVNTALPADWNGIQREAAKTRRVVILDDSKSVLHASDSLLFELSAKIHGLQTFVFRKDFSDSTWLKPNQDALWVDCGRVLKVL